jgi:glycerol-3-phosphate acyltransferase PlsY
MSANGMLIMAIACSVVISYLLGSCNSAILVCRLLKHQDIRTLGSHNAGLTNTLRCCGKGCALLTLIGDLAKGVVAVLLCKALCRLLEVSLAGDASLQFIGYIAGMAAILGHVFPLYYHFKGGKGVLVGVSVFLVIDWRSFCVMILIFAVVVAISKYVSLGSMIAAGCCPIVTLVTQLLWRPEQALWYTLLNTAMAACMGIWVIFMHRSNIARLRAGTENRFSLHKSESTQTEK